MDHVASASTDTIDSCSLVLALQTSISRSPSRRHSSPRRTTFLFGSIQQHCAGRVTFWLWEPARYRETLTAAVRGRSGASPSARALVAASPREEADEGLPEVNHESLPCRYSHLAFPDSECRATGVPGGQMAVADGGWPEWRGASDGDFAAMVGDSTSRVGRAPETVTMLAGIESHRSERISNNHGPSFSGDCGVAYIVLAVCAPGCRRRLQMPWVSRCSRDRGSPST